MKSAVMDYAVKLVAKIAQEQKDKLPILLLGDIVVLTAECVSPENGIWIINGYDEMTPLVHKIVIGEIPDVLTIELRPRQDHKELCGFNTVCLNNQVPPVYLADKNEKKKK